ncbi:hypothetical protein DPMN_110623 [Dreissena polymorpha]|uniref:Uncharacterized protein n=1 Tax=Dreissena polymorpha TaxID=45954 RepID=A0A9D4QP12_DREPO|nr:hypothetical protein DPMN_110623 [Dreissena polymorpha]
MERFGKRNTLSLSKHQIMSTVEHRVLWIVTVYTKMIHKEVVPFQQSVHQLERICWILHRQVIRFLNVFFFAMLDQSTNLAIVLLNLKHVKWFLSHN